MSIRQYIEVKSKKATGFVTGDGVIEIGTPVLNEILAVVDDSNASVMSAYATVIGGYTMKVYGAGGALIATVSKGSSVGCNYTVPIGQGVPGLGKTTYRLSFTPTTPGNNITAFTFNSELKVLQCRVNIPFLASMASVFAYCNFLQFFEFVGTTYNSCTSLASAFANCYSLEQVILPSYLNSVNSLNSTFSGTTCLNYPVIFPETMNAVTTMASCFQGSGVSSVTLPKYMNALTSLVSTFSGSKISRITFPASLQLLTSINSVATGCTALRLVTLPTSMPELLTADQAFYNSQRIESLVLPPALDKLTSMSLFAYGIPGLIYAQLPTSMNKLVSMSNAFYGCYRISSLALPNSMPELVTADSFVQSCSNLSALTMPTSMPKVATLVNSFNGTKLTTFIWNGDAPLLNSLSGAFYNCTSLLSVTLPTNLPKLTECVNAFYGCAKLVSISQFNSAPSLMVGMYSNTGLLALASFVQPFLKVKWIQITGANTSVRCPITSFQIDWAGGTYANNGTYASIDLSYLSLPASEIDRIFSLLPTVAAGIKLTVVGNPGSATCNPAIATAKGWTVAR